MCSKTLDLGDLSAGVPLKIIEIGCGAADICGPLSKRGNTTVLGVDCNQACLVEAEKRYPKLLVKLSAIGKGLAGEYDLGIMCEVLEHLHEPAEAVAAFLPRMRYSVISHPLDEPRGSSLSGGDHAWSFSSVDHREFFRVGGHVIDETEVFTMGLYRIVLSRGHRITEGSCQN